MTTSNTVLLRAVDSFLEAVGPYYARTNELTAIEDQLARDIARIFRLQERSFMRQMKRLKHLFDTDVSIREPAGPVIGDWEPILNATEITTQDAFDGLLAAAILRALLLGGRITLASFGMNLSISAAHTEAIRYVETAPLRIKGINTVTKESIRNILRDAIASGWSYDRTTAAIQKNFASMIQVVQPAQPRARLIAITEISDAYAQGTMVVARDLQAAGLLLEKAWTSEPNACPICIENAQAGWIALDAQFPSGDDRPTAHPACRCDIKQRAATNDEA